MAEPATAVAGVSQLPETLSLSPSGAPALASLHRYYIDRVTSAFAALVARAADRDPRAGESLTRLVRERSPESLLRVMLAPATTSRLLHPRAARLADDVEFLERALLVEAALAGHAVEIHGAAAWTALGDARVEPGGHVVTAPTVAGDVPLDLDSPDATTIPLAGGPRRVEQPREAPGGEQRARALSLLHGAADAIAGIGPEPQALIALFTKVVVVQQNPDSRLSSETHGRHIGRTVISSADWSKCDTAELAEALVHEAVHSLLLVSELADPWFLDDELYRRGATIASPWSGTPLKADVFVHACFVWYTLLNHWTRALTTGAFPQQRSRDQRAKAAEGFGGAALLAYLSAADRACISSHVLDAVDELDARARQLLAT